MLSMALLLLVSMASNLGTSFLVAGTLGHVCFSFVVGCVKERCEGEGCCRGRKRKEKKNPSLVMGTGMKKVQKTSHGLPFVN